MYLDLGVHRSSLWKLFWALWLPFVLSVSSICHQFSSCSHVQSRFYMICFQPTGYSPLDLKLLNNMCNCSHRNIKLLGDGLIAFTFNMLVYNFLSNLLKQLCPQLSVVHAQCGTHPDTKHHSDYFSPFKKAD